MDCCLWLQIKGQPIEYNNWPQIKEVTYGLLSLATNKGTTYRI